jgi:hypothetical protein
MLRPRVSRPVSLARGLNNQILHYLFFSLTFACILKCGTLSDVRTGLEFAMRSLIDPSHVGPYFALSSETPSTWRGKSLYLCVPRNRVTQLYPPSTGSLFVASYDSQRNCGGILISLFTDRQKTSFIIVESLGPNR